VSAGAFSAWYGFYLPLSSKKTPLALPPPVFAQVTTSSETLLERDTRILANTAAERLDTILEPLFADFHSRVPEFGEWAFGWRTGYKFLREGMLTAITLPFSQFHRMEKIDSVWNELIATKFNDLVLQPAGGIPALERAHEQWLKEMRPTVDKVMMDTLRTVTLLHGQALSSQIADEWEEDQPLPPEPSPLLMANVSSAASTIKIRTARPLLARLTIRPPVAAAVTAAGEAIGNQTETLIGSVSNLGAVIVAFLSIDYMLSQTDAGLHRPGLEADIHRIIENEHQRMRKTWLAEQQTIIDTRLSRISPLLDTEKPRASGPLPSSVPAHGALETVHPSPDP
jgi:hypothetical protein